MAAKPKPNTVALVEVTLYVDPTEDADDVIAEVWTLGDPEDRTNATVWVKEVEPVTAEGGGTDG